jgi:predicted MPP superfamily phosphohydrolase
MRRKAIIERHVVHILRDDAFLGYRIALLSDFHFAPWQSRAFLSSAVDVVNSWRPDLVALGGDYGYSVRLIPAVSRACYRVVIPRVARELSRLSAPDGVCAVLGNHDFDAGTEIVESEFAAIGIRVLRDSVHDVVRGMSSFRVAGIDDPTRGPFPTSEMQTNLLQKTAAMLLISHHPDALLQYEPSTFDVPVLIVAGHTHGGQITFPAIGAPITLSRAATRRFPAGFIPNEKVPLYVSRGLGEQMPLRVGAPRELTLLEFAAR